VVLLLLVSAAFLLCGHALSERIWRLSLPAGETHPCGGPFERTASALTTALVLLLATTWALAIPRVLTTFSLAASGSIVGLFGVLLLLRSPRTTGVAGFGRRTFLFALAICAPLLLWTGFILYRGWLLPPCSHDALSCHMPRAALIVRAEGYAFFDSTTMTVSAYPANFEMLLADVILLYGNDRVTEWVCTAGYWYLLVLAGALTERWWGRGLHVLAVVLLTALLPVALIHSGAHKNDLLMSSMILGAAMWGARWAVRGGLMPFLLVWSCVCMAVGTKLSSPFLIAGLVPLLLWRIVVLWRGPGLGSLFSGSKRRILAVVGVVVALSLLLGSATYLTNLRVLHTPFPTQTDYGFHEGYGDWANLWRFPYLLLTRPFSANDGAVWVPWRNEYWFWPKWNIYMSEFGAVTTLLVLLLPFAIWRYGRKGDVETRRERFAACVVGVITFAFIMPLQLRPLGFFAVFVRYLMYAPPLIAAWTAAPMLKELIERTPRFPQVGWGILAAISGLFLFEANRAAKNDNFAPLAVVAQAMDNPALDRTIPMRPTNAGSFVDRVAGPNDVVAFDGEFDAWTYPIFGRNLTRTVVPLHLVPGVPMEIPPEVKWVVIDRNWNMIWGAPDFHDMGQVPTLLFRGRVTEIDMQLFRQLSADRRFRLVYHFRPLMQAVFERVDGAPQ
jgi:hypothetical protein